MQVKFLKKIKKNQKIEISSEKFPRIPYSRSLMLPSLGEIMEVVAREHFFRAAKDFSESIWDF